MFERFSQDARSTIQSAESLARSTFSPAVDTRHLLVVLLKGGGSVGASVSAAGADPRALADRIQAELGQGGGLDKEALASVGIDLDSVTKRADADFGAGSLARSGTRPPGSLRLAPDTKRALQLAIRETIQDEEHEIDIRHMLLGILKEACAGRRELENAGVNLDALRRAL